MDAVHPCLRVTWVYTFPSAHQHILLQLNSYSHQSSLLSVRLPPGDLRLTWECSHPLSTTNHSPSLLETTRNSPHLGSLHNHSEQHLSIPLSLRHPPLSVHFKNALSLDPLRSHCPRPVAQCVGGDQAGVCWASPISQESSLRSPP